VSEAGGPAWLRIARENLRFLRRYTGNRVFGYIGLILLSGYAEGFGIALFLPIFAEDFAHHTDPASKVIMGVLSAVGASPTLAGALPIVAGFFLLKGLLLYAGGVMQFALSARLTREVRREMTAALAQSDYQYIVHQTSARMTALVAGEVSRATSAFLSFSRVIPNLVNIALFFAILVLLDWRLTLAISLASVVVLVSLRGPARITRKYSDLTTEASIRLSGLIIQTIQSFKYLATTGRFERFRDHTNLAVDDLAKATYRIGSLYALTGALAQPVMMVFLTAVIYWQVVIVGKALSAMLLLLLYMYRIMLEVFAFQAQWQEVAGVSGGLAATIDGIKELAQHREPNGTTPIAHIERGFELTDVDFAYGDAPVLRKLSMSIPRHSMVALVGESGAGKSTLVDLLSGILRAQSGTVAIDGHPMETIEHASLRKLIGFVPQDCVVFDDTVANNISMWMHEGDQARVEKAAKRAHADEYIRAMPKGYDTRIGERGVRLSGGQRQRLAIARELFKEPELLVLDEATSALDTESERLVQQSIDALKGSATIVVIAHRLSTVRSCDRIFVLSAGEIVEQGSFEELYAQTGSRFRRMCDLQTLQ
jgi:ABC-type multidrug transport system fused ATPase/permease subunit